jgi:ketosteroid isomerase-like protein
MGMLTRLTSVLALTCVMTIGVADAKEKSFFRPSPGPKPVVAEADGVNVVTALEKDWIGIAKNHNVKALDHFLADDFVFVYSDGRLAGKKAMSDLLKDSSGPPSTVAVLDFQVHVFAPNVIVVTSVDDIREGRPDGTEAHHQERDTDTWVLIGGHWLCVAEQTTLVADPAP